MKHGAALASASSVVVDASEDAGSATNLEANNAYEKNEEEGPQSAGSMSGQDWGWFVGSMTLADTANSSIPVSLPQSNEVTGASTESARSLREGVNSEGGAMIRVQSFSFDMEL